MGTRNMLVFAGASSEFTWISQISRNWAKEGENWGILQHANAIGVKTYIYNICICIYTHHVYIYILYTYIYIYTNTFICSYNL